jgi:kinesin family member 2/24
VSSRSHAILQARLKRKKTVFGRLNFIDLAGAERGKYQPMNFSKQDKIDSAEINKSLLALKECIRAIHLGKSHTPYRGSKLTLLLR